METNGGVLQPTPEQARAALADTDQVRASVAALSATPWPRWFAVLLAAFCAASPILLGGVLGERDWLMPHGAWLVALLVVEGLYFVAFAVAARNWRAKTGVALRMDVLPKSATVPLFIGMPLLFVGPAFVFRETGQPLWLFGAAVVGAAVSIGFHRWFVRLHRKAS
ncbi:hypothetical protein ACQB60_35970 [Actinomycetota bacterium Odt1-20B]